MTRTKPQVHRTAKTSRIQLRATEDDRDLLDRAAAALGTDRSSFLHSQGRLAAQRVLADCEQFILDQRTIHVAIPSPRLEPDTPIAQGHGHLIQELREYVGGAAQSCKG